MSPLCACAKRLAETSSVSEPISEDIWSEDIWGILPLGSDLICARAAPSDRVNCFAAFRAASAAAAFAAKTSLGNLARGLADILVL